MLGAVTAALLYEGLFASNASLAKARHFLLSSKYASGDYRKVPATAENVDGKRTAWKRG